MKKLAPVIAVLLFTSCLNEKSTNANRIDSKDSIIPPRIAQFNTVTTAKITAGAPKARVSFQAQVIITYIKEDNHITIDMRGDNGRQVIPFDFVRPFTLEKTKNYTSINFVGSTDRNDHMEIGYIFSGDSLINAVARFNRNTEVAIYENLQY